MFHDAGFDHAVRVVLEHEGLFSDNKKDPGGATKYGISLRFAQKCGLLDVRGRPLLDIDGDGDIDVDDIKGIIPQVAADIYLRSFWKPYPYALLPRPIAVKAFDLAVNMGSKQAHILLQRALLASSQSIILVDGDLGPKTVAAAKAVAPMALLAAYRSEAAGFYRGLITAKPKLEEFRNGWMYRAYY